MKKLAPFLITCFAFFSFLSLGISVWGRDDFFLKINGAHHAILDPIMMFFTHFGDGFGALSIILLVLLFINKKWGLILGLASFANAAITQILKHLFFNDIRRPLGHFGDITLLHEVKWVTIRSYFSFPSGHSSAAFCLYFLIAAMLYRNKWWQIGMALVACAIGYSRMYVSMHFPTDVLVGGLLGLLISMVTLALVEKKQWGAQTENKGLLMKSKLKG